MPRSPEGGPTPEEMGGIVSEEDQEKEAAPEGGLRPLEEMSTEEELRFHQRIREEIVDYPKRDLDDVKAIRKAQAAIAAELTNKYDFPVGIRNSPEDVIDYFFKSRITQGVIEAHKASEKKETVPDKQLLEEGQEKEVAPEGELKEKRIRAIIKDNVTIPSGEHWVVWQGIMGSDITISPGAKLTAEENCGVMNSNIRVRKGGELDLEKARTMKNNIEYEEVA